MIRYQVIWKGPLHRRGGIGNASRAYKGALQRQGVDVKVTGPLAANKRKVLIYHYLPNTLNLRAARKSYHHILINTVWETTRIPRSWVAPLNKCDAVFVPSKHNLRALRDSGVKVPIYIVPHGVNSSYFSPNNKKFPMNNTAGKFIFVSVFKFQHRKNPEALLRAYWEEFSAKDRVALVIKTSGYSKFESDQWIRNQIAKYKKQIGISKQTAPVILISRHIPTDQLKGIYTLGDVFVLPTRGEGVGLPFLESLASGTPVIATGWGGHLDFLNKNNSFLIPYKLGRPTSSMNSKGAIARTFRYLFREQGQLWAEPDLQGLRKAMRSAYSNPNLCKLKGQQGRKDSLKLSWGRSGSAMKRAVEKVISLK